MLSEKRLNGDVYVEDRRSRACTLFVCLWGGAGCRQILEKWTSPSSTLRRNKEKNKNYFVPGLFDTL